jgi:hypothetical protein
MRQEHPTNQPETDWSKFAPAVLDPEFDDLEQAEFVAWRFPERANAMTIEPCGAL